MAKRIRIDMEAAKTLARWKAAFFDDIFSRAKELAEPGGDGTMRVHHFRQAAIVAGRAFSDSLESDGGADAGQRAA